MPPAEAAAGMARGGTAPAPSIKIVLALGATYLFWGATFLAIRYAVAEVPPLLMMGLRCTGGALLLFAWASWKGSLGPATPAQWLGAAAAGVLLFLGCHGLLAWAEQRVSSGMAALYLAAVPLWLVLLDAGVRRRLPTLRVSTGLVLGIVGVAWLSWEGGEASGSGLDRAALLISGAMWAIGSIVGQRAPQPSSVIQATAMQLTGGAVALVIASLTLGEFAGWNPGGITARGAGSMLFLIVCGTAVTFLAYTWLLRVTTPAMAGSSSFVNPIVAVLLGWLVQDGVTTTRMLVASPLVIAAVALSREPAPARGRRLRRRLRAKAAARYAGAKR